LNQCRPKGLNLINARRAARLILEQARIERVVLGHVQHPDQPALEAQRRIAAIVLAGGLSRRMGQPKPLLQWGQHSVIEAIVGRLVHLRFADVLVVTGHKAGEVSAKVKKAGGRSVHNAAYASGEMLSSLQTGLAALDDSISAAMVFLGDQPMLNPRLIHHLLLAYATGKGTLVAPSYQQRRGHPILIDRRYWRDLLELPPGSAPRDVINANASDMAYVVTDDPGVLQDMDTPEDYQAALRRAGLD
jgi:molybdenum cofactor cytidylyltransferase